MTKAEKKLTPAQRELYEAMKKGVVCIWMNAWDGSSYYFRTDTMRRCTAQARKLKNIGLVEVKARDWRGHQLYVSNQDSK